MEGRCDVCRALRPRLSGVVTVAGTMRACAGCESAVNRVAELEQREASLTRALARVGEVLPQTQDVVNAALRASTTPEVNKTARLVEALQAFLRATHTSQGGFSGHTLEEIKRPGLPTTWACIMPGCAVCNARGVAEEALGTLS